MFTIFRVLLQFVLLMILIIMDFYRLITKWSSNRVFTIFCVLLQFASTVPLMILISMDFYDGVRIECLLYFVSFCNLH